MVARIIDRGCFARFVKAPQKALHPIRDDIPLKEAVWGELLSCVLGTTDRVHIQPGQVGVVIGNRNRRRQGRRCNEGSGSAKGK